MSRSGLGFRVRQLRRAWVAEVWTGRGYRSTSFPPNREGERAAQKFGADEAAKVRAGIAARARFPAATGRMAADYVAELRALGRSAKHTGEVERQLRVFAAEVPDLGAKDAQDATTRFLAAPPASDDDRAAPLSAATRNRWLVTVRGMCRWGMLHERLTQDPTRLLRFAQLEEPLPPTFGLDELRTCLAHTHFPTPRARKPTPNPYHALFATLVYTGFRFQEAARLHWEDIDWTGGAVLLRLRAGAVIKRRRERLVPLQAELAAILEPFRQLTGPIFLGRVHNPYRGFANFLTRCGVPIDGRSPHACRHTWASMLSATGVPVQTLAGYMGHRKIETTMIYTQLATRYLGEAQHWKRGEIRLTMPATAPAGTG